MGSSLSAEEELFVSFRWDQLLTEVEEGRHNVREEHNSDDDDGDDDVAPTGTSSAIKKKGFSLSLEEWQALLSLLECKDSAPSAAASLLCERLTAEELRCPLVALTVHVCLWWSGSITEDVLLSRLDGLQHLMEEVEATHTNTQTHSDAQPSRRQRLLQSVRTRISLPRRGGSTSPFFGSTQDVYCGMDLVRAVQQHRSQSSPVADRGGMDARRCQYLDLMEVANGTTQPVMCVCWRLFLAALACLAPHLSLSEEGIEQLRQLAIAFRAHNRTQHANNEDELLPMMTKQTVVAALEVALVELQYKMDVCEVMGSDGARLANELNDARLGREKLAHQATGTSSSSSSSSSPTARWDACMSQFIGQRHIWRALRNQFLSADVFDSAKPTVIIFFGPSGYGKSEMAKQIASALHGCTVAALEPLGKLIHIHMPSFCTKDSIYSLVDPPAAHIGDGMLLSALLQHKDAVVVLDEFEKSTAEAIQNLWLSAFQKDGTLRSLKDAARSVSTVKATFILTCNVVAEAINERAGLYLSATAEDQARMRAIYETMCRGVCRDVFGEPFVNRVDFFFPFVPYSVAERRSFVVMQLERCVAAQAAKGRTLHITPRFVAAMAMQLTSFHATTVEEIFRPLILHMANRGWQRAVLTVEHRSTSAIRSNNHSNNDDDDDVPSFYWRGMDKFVVMAAVDEAEGRCWAQLEGGEACLARWASPLETQTSKEEEAPRTSQPSTKDVVVEPTHKTEIGGLTAAAEGLRQRRVTAGGGGMEMAMHTDVDLHTQRETELEVEVNTLRELLVHKDAEIERLTGKTLVLQRCMGLVMCMSAAMAVLLYTMVGMQMMIFFAILSGLTMAVLLKLPLAVLLQSLRVLYAFLGPVRSAILLGVVAVWMALASRKVLYCR